MLMVAGALERELGIRCADYLDLLHGQVSFALTQNGWGTQPEAKLGILLLIGTWNNLLWAFIVLRTEDMYTLPLLIYLLKGETETPWGMLMASGLLATLPLIVAFLFFQRSFIAGITAGAVKS